MRKTQSQKLNKDCNLLICQVCQKESSLSCSNCRKAWYCSRHHQKEDWSTHKKDCYPGQVAVNPVFGRYLTATRPVAEGSLILREKPLFSAPSNGKNVAWPLCLGCYGIVLTEKCSNCGWPLHEECAKNKVHLNNECRIFSKFGLSPESLGASVYTKILVLRGCLLKLNDLPKWELVNQLQDHREERINIQDGVDDSKFMIHFVKTKCGLGPAFSEEEIDHIYGSAIVNAYLAEDDVLSSPNFHAGCFVYWKASLPAHDCRPNCKWTILKGGELRLTALRDIKEGESLTHCYAWGGNGTLERQKHLRVSKFFTCGCSRCLDPTEGGSFFSGLKCRGEACSGFVLSNNPTKLGSDWSCNSCGGSLTTEAEVEELIQQLRNAHKAQGCSNASQIGGQMADWRQVVEKLEEVKTVFLSRVGPSHFLVHEIEQDILSNVSYILAQGDGSDGSEMMEMTKEEKLSLARILTTLSKKWMIILAKIGQGPRTPHVGRQLYYLQQGLGILIQNQIEGQGQDEAGEESQSTKETLLEDISEWQEVRRKCLQALETESPGREDWIMGQAMKVN